MESYNPGRLKFQINTGRKRLATNFLTSSPSLITGAATVVNLAGNFYKFNRFQTGEISDRTALSQDFHMIGQDIRDIFERETNQNSNDDC